MNEFQKKRISKGPAPSERKTIETEKVKKRAETKEKLRQIPIISALLDFSKHHYIWATIIIILFAGVTKAAWNVVTLAENFSIKEVALSIFSEKIKTDTENHTNILLLGTGTEEHDGAELTDTIIVVSLDHDQNTASMLSIPRDLYVEIDELYGGNRINSVWELVAETDIYENETPEKEAYKKSYDVLTRTISEIVDLPIHYYTRIDFDGFTEIVDAIGGVDVYVEEDIYDPYYPAENGTIGYQIFSVSAGNQHLDGDTALKYVRSRKTTSDFDRSARQQQVLSSIKDKALSLGVLGSPSKLKNIFTVINDNFDTNLEWDEMVYLAKIADNFDTNSLTTWVLNDNPLTAGGFLYTPDREFYGGAFVLVPFTNDYLDIQQFADTVLMNPESHSENMNLQITNGTGANGIATETMYYLGRYGYDIVRFGNAANQGIPTTRIIPRTALLSGQDAETINSDPSLNYFHENYIPVGFVMTELPQEYSPAEWETEADVIIELGQDYVDWMTDNQISFY
ncbi:LCP family protein [Candidatus Peregrinibacteria bacterium]|jgi:polyisoprenyl-teichoic acid--peptidoglycan teichoic acid transferase|nr:LCP family protein [Candidatus Peregrinibacteria bacterium]MBT7483871.1 LCP family protein [Candidatus Peregrinibacteria bacterium]MBT7702688.1 LCP family protein [Candidatus Peregrinibacteria bacterium]